ncbi:MAG: MtrB/PioB family outer membrane beta-barrel protein [Acidobacteria bacterium]|nr:MtrB/PioB family outer membrane beta-barrel protein [Acidobacteriota bacterium]
MRNYTALALLVALMIPATVAAQETTTSNTSSGWVDFGVRGSSLTGDASRYERYRDLGDGLFLETFRWKAQRDGWFLNAGADHVARRDQRYTVGVARPGTFKGWAQWDQIPMLLSRTTRTPYSSTVPGEFRLDDTIQAQLQALPASQRSAAVQALVNGSPLFDLKSQRHSAAGKFEFMPTTNSSLKVSVKQDYREGAQPFGAGFGHSQLVEFAAPIDHKLTNFEASAELERGPALFRAGYMGSWFTNEVTTVIFDNPLRATDISGAPASGRLSLPVSSTQLGVNGMVSVKLPQKSRLTVYATLSTLTDDSGMVLPHTSNTAVLAAAGPLDRTSLNGEAKISGLNLNFTSRPSKLLSLNARMRYYDYDNRIPSFTVPLRVSYDSSVRVLNPPLHTAGYGVTRLNLDADVRFTPKGPAALTLGYGRYSDERTHRIFEETVDNVMRVKLDTISTGLFTVRAVYEHAQRRGEGFDVNALIHANEQPGMRHYDVANRDRDRFTVMASFMPVTNWAINVSSAIGRDDYLNSEFGLRDNNHDVYTIGLDGSPSETVGLGLSYSYEDYRSLSRSRQANPGAQFFDPSRNWATDANDKAHSVVANAEFKRIAEKVDLAFSYDYNRTRATYEYITGAVPDRTLPLEAVVPTTLPTPTALPPVKSELSRGTVDATYHINNRIALAVSYWYDKYDVQDFTLDSQAQQTLTAGNNMLLYYTYAPYTAHTTWGRVIVRW